ncbi:MAG: hypothetical protein ACRDQ4_01870 [Pseudonocardiaceae bacterium]
MPRQLWIAEIQISEEMESKIGSRRFVTGDQVREACIPDAYERTGWHNHPEHGRRLLVVCHTSDNVRLKVILQPVDIVEGIWRLRTVLRMM